MKIAPEYLPDNHIEIDILQVIHIKYDSRSFYLDRGLIDFNLQFWNLAEIFQSIQLGSEEDNWIEN